MYLQINKYKKERGIYIPLFYVEVNVVYQEESTLNIYNQHIIEYFFIPLIGYSYRVYDETFIDDNIERFEWDKLKQFFYSEFKGYYLLPKNIYRISIEDCEPVDVTFDHYDKKTESFIFNNGTLSLKFNEFNILNKCS